MGLMIPESGLTNSKLELATATQADVLSGKSFYAVDNVLKSGTLNPSINTRIDPGVNHDNWVNGHKARAGATINISVKGNTLRVWGTISSWLEGNESGGGATASFDQSWKLY